MARKKKVEWVVPFPLTRFSLRPQPFERGQPKHAAKRKLLPSCARLYVDQLFRFVALHDNKKNALVSPSSPHFTNPCLHSDNKTKNDIARCRYQDRACTLRQNTRNLSDVSSMARSLLLSLDGSMSYSTMFTSKVPRKKYGTLA